MLTCTCRQRRLHPNLSHRLSPPPPHLEEEPGTNTSCTPDSIWCIVPELTISHERIFMALSEFHSWDSTKHLLHCKRQKLRGGHLVMRLEFWSTASKLAVGTAVEIWNGFSMRIVSLWNRLSEETTHNIHGVLIIEHSHTQQQESENLHRVLPLIDYERVLEGLLRSNSGGGG